MPYGSIYSLSNIMVHEYELIAEVVYGDLIHVRWSHFTANSDRCGWFHQILMGWSHPCLIAIDHD